MADNETLLISRLIRCNDPDEVSTFFKEQLTPTHLKSRVKELEYIFKFYDKHRKVPSKVLFKKNFPSFRLAKAKDPVTAYTEEIRTQRCWVRINKMMEGVEKVLDKSGDVKDAVSVIGAALAKLQTESLNFQGKAWHDEEDVAERARKYKQKEESGVHGIPLPWEPLDEAFSGLNDGHLIGILARPFMGKTWLMIYIAWFAWSKGYNVLFITKEMSEEEIARRLDAIDLDLPYKSFRKVKLNKKDRKKFLKHKPRKRSKAKFIITDNAGGGVRSVGALMDEHKPDVVFIDSYYLLEDDRKSTSKTERFYSVSQDLKLLTKKQNVPVVVTTQQGRGADRSKGGGLDSPMWGDVVAQIFDDLFEVMAELDELNMSDERDILTVKTREGESVRFTINFFDNSKPRFNEAMTSNFYEEDTDEVESDEEVPIAQTHKLELNFEKKKKRKKGKKKRA